MASSREIAQEQGAEDQQESATNDRLPPLVGQWQPLAQVSQEKKRASGAPALLVGVALLLILGGLVAWQFRLVPAGAEIGAIERGALSVRSGPGEAWVDGQPGQTLAEGVLIETQPNAVITLSLADGSLCRIESAGTWQILELRRSRNGRIARTTLHQLSGQASYMSRPPQRAVDARLRISLPSDATLELSGVATVTVDPPTTAQIQLLQGKGQLRAWDRDLSLTPGQRLLLDLQARSVQGR